MYSAKAPDTVANVTYDMHRLGVVLRHAVHMLRIWLPKTLLLRLLLLLLHSSDWHPFLVTSCAYVSYDVPGHLVFSRLRLYEYIIRRPYAAEAAPYALYPDFPFSTNTARPTEENKARQLNKSPSLIHRYYNNLYTPFSPLSFCGVSRTSSSLNTCTCALSRPREGKAPPQRIAPACKKLSIPFCSPYLVSATSFSCYRLLSASYTQQRSVRCTFGILADARRPLQDGVPAAGQHFHKGSRILLPFLAFFSSAGAFHGVQITQQNRSHSQTRTAFSCGRPLFVRVPYCRNSREPYTETAGDCLGNPYAYSGSKLASTLPSSNSACREGILFSSICRDERAAVRSNTQERKKVWRRGFCAGSSIAIQSRAKIGKAFVLFSRRAIAAETSCSVLPLTTSASTAAQASTAGARAAVAAAATSAAAIRAALFSVSLFKTETLLPSSPFPEGATQTKAQAAPVRGRVLHRTVLLANIPRPPAKAPLAVDNSRKLALPLPPPPPAAAAQRLTTSASASRTKPSSGAVSSFSQGITSYPFESIEKKWASYYAEHSEDFSPLLPCVGFKGEEDVSGRAEKLQAPLFLPISASPCVRSGACVKAGEYAGKPAESGNPGEEKWIFSSAAQDAARNTTAAVAPCAKPATEALDVDTAEVHEASVTAGKNLELCWEEGNDTVGRVNGTASGDQLQVRDFTEAEEARDYSILPALEAAAPGIARSAQAAEAMGLHVAHLSKHAPVVQGRRRQQDGGDSEGDLTTVPGEIARCAGFLAQEDACGKGEKKQIATCAALGTAAYVQRTKASFLQGDKEELAGRTAAVPVAHGRVEETKKCYILSMIPYPSGEGLHVGHSLTYTVADVVARYKRLQLRGELLQIQERKNEGEWKSDSKEAKERKKRRQIKEHRDLGSQHTVLQKKPELSKSSTERDFFEKLEKERQFTPGGRHGGPGKSAEALVQEQDTSGGDHVSLPMQAEAALTASKGAAGEDRRGSTRSEGAARAMPERRDEEAEARIVGREEKHQSLPGALQRPDVMHVIGWDAFGLPAEQYAMKSGISPRLSVRKNIQRFRQQLQRLGLAVDWRRELDTSDPEFFRWTQWIFLQMWKRGLVYEKAASVNWCETLGTVLADEEVVDGVSKRGKHPVEKRHLKQWHLRITAYAEELQKTLSQLDWPERVISMQRNWIGKRDVAHLKLPLLSSLDAEVKRFLAREIHNEENHDSAALHAAYARGEEAHPCGKSTDPLLQGDQISSGTGLCRMGDDVDITHSHTKGMKSFSSLRCVSISPELLFGATFIILHAANEQAHVVALTPAARSWLAKQGRKLPHREEWQRDSPLHKGKYDSPAKEQNGISTVEQGGRADPTVAEIHMEKKECEVTVDGKGGPVAAAGYSEERKTCDTSRYFCEKESCFSGSYVKHPLNRTLLPVWLFSGTLFDQLKGAGTYFSLDEALFAVPIQDKVAEEFARAAALPVVNVLGLKADEASHKETMAAADRTETEPLHKKLYMNRNLEKRETADHSVHEIVVNSQCENLNLNGLSRARARQLILEHLKSAGLGEQQAVFALRDWVFSRQRFWGEPIPLIRARLVGDERAFVLAESEANLPVTLPEEIFRARDCKRQKSTTGWLLRTSLSESSSSRRNACSKSEWARKQRGIFNGKEYASAEEDNKKSFEPASLMAPLADYPQWWNITQKTVADAHMEGRSCCFSNKGAVETQKGAEKAERKTTTKIDFHREVSTMPQWAGSSWYFLRFLDPHNRHEAFSREVARYWMPVDLYIGGMEHAVTHLLYARFWHKFLRDIGCVTSEEPFKRLCTPGIILGPPRYVAFQRRDTMEWISASSVFPQKLSNSTVSDTLQEHAHHCAIRVSPSRTASSTADVKTAMQTHVESGIYEVDRETNDSILNRKVNASHTATEAGGAYGSTLPRAKSEKSTTVDVFRLAGTPVREVEIENTAVQHTRESDVPVLKENKNIEVLCRYEKMSKSRGNVVSQDSLIESYGADVLRLHLLLMGPIEIQKVWTLSGIRGASRFLNRMWHLIVDGQNTGTQPSNISKSTPAGGSCSSSQNVYSGVSGTDLTFEKNQGQIDEKGAAQRESKYSLSSPTSFCATTTPRRSKAEPRVTFSHRESCSHLENSPLSTLEVTLLAPLVEQVTRDLDRLAFNTALSALMYTVKQLCQWKADGRAISVHAALILTRLLHPFAPLITEELWFRIHKRFPNASRYASSPSLLACAVWPAAADLEFDLYAKANVECTTAEQQTVPMGTATGTELSVDVGVYVDGRFKVKVQVPASCLGDKRALEEYVSSAPQVGRLLCNKKVYRIVVVLKAKIVNFVTRHTHSGERESSTARQIKDFSSVVRDKSHLHGLI